jgi:hypothetical protein
MFTPTERTHVHTPDETINATAFEVILSVSLGCVTARLRS